MGLGEREGNGEEGRTGEVERERVTRGSHHELVGFEVKYKG
jgi:hypothetical protein